MKYFALILTISLNSFSATPKNIVFIIADGMGLASLTGARIYHKGSKGSLEMEKFKTIGLVKTYSSDDFTTDSAAGATAYSAGVKTYNGSIAMSKNKKNPKPLKTIVDVLKKKNYAFGIITTTEVTHATPASFYAHAKSRKETNRIASQVASSNIDFLLGGGSQFFSRFQSDLKKNNWLHINKKSELKSTPKNKKILGTFAKEHLPYPDEDQEDAPNLKDMTEWSINRLKQSKQGYFLLIEAGRIDHAAHANKAKEHFQEVIQLDEAVKYLLKTVNLKETLIVITADHETGGLSLNGYGNVDKTKGNKFIKGVSLKGATPHITWATGKGVEKSAHAQYLASHTAIDVPLYATGAGHEAFSGFMENSEVTRRMLKLLGLKL